MKVLIAIIIVLLSQNLRLVLCHIFSYDFPKIRNRPKIFLRSFENVARPRCIRIIFTSEYEQSYKMLSCR